jgi:U3 small nucleolar RNA-associated protein 10
MTPAYLNPFFYRAASEDITALSRLSLVLEILVSQTLPGSLEIVSGCLEALNRVISSSLDTADSNVVYIEQLLMSCLESSASQIKVCYAYITY